MNTNDTLQTKEVAETLGLHEKVGRRLVIRTIGVIAAIAAFWVALLAMHGRRSAATAVRYETAPVTRGNLVETISATGTLAPVNQVEVGSEVSGTMKSVEVNYNDRVKVGQVLARIDTSKLAAQVQQSESALESARAKVLDAEATLKESESQLRRLRQAHELSGGKVPSQNELDAQEATVARAKAGCASSQAAVSLAQATLNVDQSNMDKAVIHSPINGVVLTRQIEPGQTVAATFEAPVLFKLAEDLSKLELQVDVDEADVGRVREGQEATFTVDAYPDKHFPATITQVRYGSKTTEGVVTYTTVLKVSNDDLSLRPGMTATAVITTRKADNVLLVPSAALRFELPPEPTNGNATGAASRKPSLISSLLPHPPQREARPNGADKTGKAPTVFVLKNGQLRETTVTSGLTDGAHTEVAGDGLDVGLHVVTAITAGQK